MNIYQWGTIAHMALQKNVIKSLYAMYDMLKEDAHFTPVKYIKMICNIIKGEKIVRFEDKYVLSTFLPPFPSRAFDTNLKAVECPQNIFTQQIYAKRSAPISMYLCLTHKCPNNCLYCSAKNRNDEGELTTKEWTEVIKDLQDMRTPIIGLTGGEPMIREDIFEIVKAIDDRSTSILFTSGCNLTLERAKELKKHGLFGIGISLDSYDKRTHNQNRKSEKAFDDAVRALQNAREAGLYTMAQTVILKEDVEEEKLFKLFALAQENGAHEVKILEPILSGNLLTAQNPDKILYDKAVRKNLIEIQHKANRKSKFPKITTFAYTESEEKYGCGAGVQHSYISAAGHLYPCDFVPMTFGSVRERSIKELWKEMNKVIGLPKIGCFAQKVNRQVYRKAEGILPLNKEESVNICLKHRSDKFPAYYRELMDS
ncbi:MAG: radical SAM protein [Firmicutes bacterium]|nr:radical SAM protein [Bacillota bacterium]